MNICKFMSASVSDKLLVYCRHVNFQESAEIANVAGIWYKMGWQGVSQLYRVQTFGMSCVVPVDFFIVIFEAKA